jgi:hypothetical protein
LRELFSCFWVMKQGNIGKSNLGECLKEVIGNAM